MAGLLYSLPSTDPYNPPEYVPVPLTGVRIHVRVVNFIAQVGTFGYSSFLAPHLGYSSFLATHFGYSHFLPNILITFVSSTIFDLFTPGVKIICLYDQSLTLTLHCTDDSPIS